MWQGHDLPVPTPEHRFHQVRRWRIDYAFIEEKLAIEIEGGIWTRGRHTRGKGYKKDLEKYNMLQEMGWILLRYTPKGVDFAQIKRVLSSRNKA